MKLKGHHIIAWYLSDLLFFFFKCQKFLPSITTHSVSLKQSGVKCLFKGGAGLSREPFCNSSVAQRNSCVFHHVPEHKLLSHSTLHWFGWLFFYRIGLKAITLCCLKCFPLSKPMSWSPIQDRSNCWLPWERGWGQAERDRCDFSTTDKIMISIHIFWDFSSITIIPGSTVV